MIRRRWNALHVGDHVLVHDDTSAALPLVQARVVAVEPGPGSNVVSVRIPPRGGTGRVVQPRRLTVHLDSGEATERCWRCEALYAARQ